VQYEYEFTTIFLASMPPCDDFSGYSMKRILSGMQPTGRLHLGNYFGMMVPAIALQEQGEALYFIADYHALTTVHDPTALRQNCFDLAVDFLACGLDPEKSIFYRQSDVPEVTELSWILSTITPQGLLERCHSYKDKTAKGLPATNGLFSYPVLMAADILLYDSDEVPVLPNYRRHLSEKKLPRYRGWMGKK